jgi:hypothetical protein
MVYSFTNHWLCNKDWLEFILFSIIWDWKEPQYKYIQITVLNFEFVLSDNKEMK